MRGRWRTRQESGVVLWLPLEFLPYLPLVITGWGMEARQPPPRIAPDQRVLLQKQEAWTGT